MAQIIKAGANQPTQGERSAADLLRQLPKSWVVIANKILPLSHADSYEMDFIVIGDHRLILIDEKSYGGTITGTDEIWTLSRGQAIRSPFNKMDMNAKRLAGWLESRVTGMPGRNSRTIPILGGVMLSNPNASPSISDVRASRCLFTVDNAIERLIWLDQEGARADFDIARVREKIVNTLYNDNSARQPSRPSFIGLFEIEDEIERRHSCRIFLGKHEGGDRRTLYVYENSLATQGVLDQEINALNALQSSGVVPAMADAFLWSEDQYRVIPVKSPAGTAIGARPLPQDEDQAIREIEIASAAFNALSKIHAGKVVHRAIGPASVFVDESVEGLDNQTKSRTPKIMFAGFVAARIEDTRTISPTLDKTGFDDPYAAPEIRRLQSYGFADPTSDVYSLALVTLERISRFRVAQLTEMVDADKAIPVETGQWPFLSEQAVSRLKNIYGAALSLGPYANLPRSTAQRVGDELAQLAKELRFGQVLPKGLIAGTSYEVKALLGTGASARTYLVYDTEKGVHFAGKQHYRSEAAQIESDLTREFQILWGHYQENLPRVLEPRVNDPYFQSRLEWIDGESLRARIPSIRHDRQRWTNLKNDLLSAVGHLESLGILHRDIKPENVMLRNSDGRAFLIDYGSTSTSSEPGELAGSPRYWPPEWRTGDGYPASGDRYAVAVTLFEALTGKLPFDLEGAGFSSEPLAKPPAEMPEDLHEVARVLLQAVSVNSSDRYESIPDLRNALDQALANGTREIVSDEESISDVSLHAITGWTDNLRGLYRNSSRGNADNRGLDTEFARETYVPTALDNRLWPAIEQHRPAAVFLSGNPGDGKTAFLEMVRHELVSRGASISDLSDQSGWEAAMNGHAYRACFDASEAANGMTANEQVSHRLRGLDGEVPEPGITVLLAINDGRLSEVREEFEDDFPWLTSQLALATKRNHVLEPTTDWIWLIDLKQRSYVALTQGLDSRSTMREMLARMVDASHWPEAEKIASTFVGAANALALREKGPDSPATRLEFLLALAHLRGTRHTTVRDLRSALAYLITADVNYDDVEELGARDFPWEGKYWNTVFTTDSAQDLVLGELRWLDPGRFPHPDLERFLYFRHRPEDAATRSKLFANGIDEPPPAGDDPFQLKEWIRAFKRRLVLEGAPPSDDAPIRIDPLDLLPYRESRIALQILAGEKPTDALLPPILRGISRSDDIDHAVADDGLVLKVKKSDEYNIELVKSFPASDFLLEVNHRTGAELVETTARTLVLTHTVSTASVQLNLDMIDVLLRLSNGLEPATFELQPFLEELNTFKSTIQRSVSDQLLVLDGQRRYRLLKNGERLVLTTS